MDNSKKIKILMLSRPLASRPARRLRPDMRSIARNTTHVHAAHAITRGAEVLPVVLARAIAAPADDARETLHECAHTLTYVAEVLAVVLARATAALASTYSRIRTPVTWHVEHDLPRSLAHVAGVLAVVLAGAAAASARDEK